MQIFLKNFKPKKDLTFEPLPDAYYDATKDGGYYLIKGPDGTEHALTAGHNDNKYFSCNVDEVITLTQENLQDMLKEHVSQARNQMEEDKQMAKDLMAEVIEFDTSLALPFANLCDHILQTFQDKYESDPFPAMDLYGLMRGGSKLGSGFNVGCAAKYLKRYMTEGKEKSYNPEDLLKAIHYLLFEYDARLNSNESNK